MRRAKPLGAFTRDDRGRRFHRVGTDLILPEQEPPQTRVVDSQASTSAGALHLKVLFYNQASVLFGKFTKTE